MFNDKLEADYSTFLSTDYDNLSPQNKYDFITNSIILAIKSSTPVKKKFHLTFTEILSLGGI